jgi:hypothetical protein
LDTHIEQFVEDTGQLQSKVSLVAINTSDSEPSAAFTRISTCSWVIDNRKGDIWAECRRGNSNQRVFPIDSFVVFKYYIGEYTANAKTSGSEVWQCVWPILGTKDGEIVTRSNYAHSNNPDIGNNSCGGMSEVIHFTVVAGATHTGVRHYNV